MYFISQELERYQKAHKAFVYNVHGFESPVGPVKVRGLGRRGGWVGGRKHGRSHCYDSN